MRVQSYADPRWAQAQRLTSISEELINGEQNVGEDQPQYGVLVSLYQQPDR